MGIPLSTWYPKAWGELSTKTDFFKSRPKTFRSFKKFPSTERHDSRNIRCLMYLFSVRGKKQKKYQWRKQTQNSLDKKHSTHTHIHASTSRHKSLFSFFITTFNYVPGSIRLSKASAYTCWLAVKTITSNLSAIASKNSWRWGLNRT